MSELKDWRGTPIEVGSTIVYPGRHGSWIWMNEGEVISIAPREPKYFSRPVTLTVRRTRDSGDWGGKEKVVSVYAVERVTVVS